MNTLVKNTINFVTSVDYEAIPTEFSTFHEH